MTIDSKKAVRKSLWLELPIAMGFVLFALLLGGYIPHVLAQQQQQQEQQRTFHSAEEASGAFFAAAQKDDEKVLLDILGPAGKEVISSGDNVEDLDARVGFVVKYQEMHRLAKEPNGTTTLYIGAENWPFPIPLANKNGVWYFDTAAGKEEILLRRIGSNELAAIDACRQLVDAQKQYFAKVRQGDSTHEYAQKFVSDKGQHNGLYWSGTDDDYDSVLDPLVASAGAVNSGDDWVNDRTPFNGYYFRILKRQGDDATDEAASYVENGKMIRGFAFVAFPAEYRSSGVTTFIVNQTGVVYEKDLGPDTTKLATAMTTYSPDSTWRRSE